METILCGCNEKTHLGTWGHRWRLAAPDSQAVPVWRHQTRIVHLLLPSHRPSPRHLEVGHGARLPQRRHTVHTGLFKHVLPADFVCAGAVLLRGCVWLYERGCSLAAVSRRWASAALACLQHVGSRTCLEQSLRLTDSLAPWRVGSPRITD